MKQDLSEVFAVYLSFATELEEQIKQLLEKLEQATCSLRSHYGGKVQSKYLRVWPQELNIGVAPLTSPRGWAAEGMINPFPFL